jgi:aspartyl protease family protein
MPNMKYYFLLIVIIFVSILLQSCGGCSNKRIRVPTTERNEEFLPQVAVAEKPEENIVNMLQEGDGVYRIPVFINDVQMKFIFDTGAGMISMSATEARFLYKQGTLTDEDFLGTLNFSDANGDITPGMVVRLRTVKIGNKILENIEASIVDNDKAPLLLGQTALEKFGKISIDYTKGTIAFE